MRPIAAAIEKRTQADRDQKQDFDRGKEGRHSAAKVYGRAVDQNSQRNGGERNELQASEGNIQVGKSKEGLIQRALQQRIKKDRKAHGERGSRGAARNCKLRPTIDESPRPAVSVAHDAVLARGARHHRQKLCVGERARQRKQSGDQPNSQRFSRRAHIAGHHAGFKKDAGADYIRDIDRDRGDQAKATNELAIRKPRFWSFEFRVHSLNYPQTAQITQIQKKELATKRLKRKSLTRIGLNEN